MSEVLRESSNPHDYYLGDKPGTLQYKKEIQELISINSSFNPEADYKNGFELEIHSQENLKRLTPDTDTGNSNDWKLLLVIKKISSDNTVWLKGALLNKNTTEIALMTSTNKPEHLNRKIKSLDSEWFIGHYRMAAPLFFWEELKNRILY